MPQEETLKAKDSHTSSLHRAMTEAQHLAFAPVSFMSAYCLKRMGVLEALWQVLSEGMNEEELADETGLSTYAASVLLESGLAIGALARRDDRYHLSKLGHVLRTDPMTDANFEFIYRVCYQGLFHLEDSLRKGEPLGLPSISSAKTVYEGLHDLAPPVRKAWLDFDHFYSDSAFGGALAKIFSHPPRSLLDIGGNTGRFAKACLDYNPSVRVTICDLPQQIVMAGAFLEKEVDRGRVRFHGCDLLEPEASLPAGHDAIWMSQFLVCFDEETLTRILSKASAALSPEGRLFILDTFWDRQEDPVSAFCLIQTSPYFTTIANGKSKIYRSDTIIERARQAGLLFQSVHDGLGISHSLLTFVKA